MADFYVKYEENRRARALGLDIMQASTGAGFQASFAEAMVRNPTPSIYRDAARQNYYERTHTDEFGQEHTIPAKPSKILSAEEANWRYSVKGRLTFDSDVPEPVAKELRDLKLGEIQRADTLRRSEAGLGTRLSASLLGSLIDPLNIASAFIPVVGQARYAALAERLGPAGARATVGAIEGGVGAAMLEPFVYNAAVKEQADYSMADSMANIVFGGILGGGLHLGAGFIGDRLAGRRNATPLQREIDALPAEDQAQMLRAAESQILEGRPVDVSPVADAILPSRMVEQLKQTSMERAPGEPVADFERRKAMIQRVDPEAVQAIDDIKTEVEQLNYWMGALQKATTERGPVDEAAQRVLDLRQKLDDMGPETDWRDVRDIQSEIDMLTQEFSSPTRPMKQVLAEHADRGKKSAANVRKIQRRIDYLQGKLPELNRRVAQAYSTGQQMLTRSSAGRNIVKRAKEQSRPHTDPRDAQNSANFEKMAQREQGPPPDVDTEIAAVEAELAELEEFVDMTEFETAEIRQVAQRAERENEAIRRAAGCKLEQS
jgi:hypothetical protein